MTSLDGPLVVGTALLTLAALWLLVSVVRWVASGPQLDDTDDRDLDGNVAFYDRQGVTR